jgi:high-affinity nickel-transport protein
MWGCSALAFGLGSIGGMMAMSALVGLPLQLTVGRFGRANQALRAAAGLVSLTCGVLLAYDIGFGEGLLFR